nr:MAG TPA: hypothetical protein [Bacteriophage sp.]
MRFTSYQNSTFCVLEVSAILNKKGNIQKSMLPIKNLFYYFLILFTSVPPLR